MDAVWGTVCPAVPFHLVPLPMRPHLKNLYLKGGKPRPIPGAVGCRATGKSYAARRVQRRQDHQQKKFSWQYFAASCMLSVLYAWLLLFLFAWAAFNAAR